MPVFTVGARSLCCLTVLTDRRNRSAVFNHVFNWESIMLRYCLAAGLVLSSGLLPISSARAADIVFTEGEGDVTFFYESQNQTWHTVFREKGETTATGLDSPFSGFDGIVGLGTDFNFSSLNTLIDTNTSVSVGGNSFWVSSAEGSSIFDEGTTDLGIRMRLRENFGTIVNQFDSFNLSLNVAGSTFNGNPLAGSGAEVSLLSWDAFQNPVPLINTADSLLTANLPSYEHIHRHWGFSEYGTYELAFDFAGVGGLYGSSAPGGSTRLSFSVVPEPSALLLTGMCTIGLVYRRRRMPTN
jgi:hypothetical protein